MLNFFTKKQLNENIYSPITGKCIDISEVNDQVFASKLMGDGCAIIPEDTIVKAPCDGKIVMMFETKHAFGIKMKNGVEILIHIGIDTVNLNGEGFKSLKKINDYVKKGDHIIVFDEDLRNLKDIDMTTMILITDQKGLEYSKINLNCSVNENVCILKSATGVVT